MPLLCNFVVSQGFIVLFECLVDSGTPKAANPGELNCFLRICHCLVVLSASLILQ